MPLSLGSKYNIFWGILLAFSTLGIAVSWRGAGSGHAARFPAAAVLHCGHARLSGDSALSGCRWSRFSSALPPAESGMPGSGSGSWRPSWSE
ncbi:MAG: hypothetical protein MZV70_20095 [Desulfobacterales bacterium]|nr:hypothetical protein [Desulfobacterales bacterium]